MESESDRLVSLIKRLDESLENLDSEQAAPVLGHWRHLEPESVRMAYDMIEQGSSLVEHTSTKLTLLAKVSKASSEEIDKIAQELMKGCESLAMAALVFCDSESGCSCSLRKHSKRHVRGVLLSCIQLMESIAQNRLSEGALKTAAVWDATQNLAKLPKGNRNSVRRDLLSYMADCTDTMQEFQEIVDKSTPPCADDDEHRYFPIHVPVARACIALVKCSRGVLNTVLKACDCVGSEIDNSASDGRAENFGFIRRIVDQATEVGEGMTDMASYLYPPLEIEEETTTGEHLVPQVDLQYQRLKSVLKCVESNETCIQSEEISDMVRKLVRAVDGRYREAKQSIKDALT